MVNYASPPRSGARSNVAEEKFQETLREWTKFINGDDEIDEAVIPREVLDSWHRCRALGVDPMSRNIKVLAGKELDDLLKKNEPLIKAGRQFMTQFYSFTMGSRFAVILFDSNAYMLEIMVREEFRDIAIRERLVVGSLWDEASAGNNGVGTVVALKTPVRIFGAQHYVKSSHQDAVSSAPIFSSEGEFLGGIVVLGFYYGSAIPHTFGMALAAAKAVENRLQIEQALEEARIAGSYQKTVMASIPEALIAVDNNGTITLTNDNARKMFFFEYGSVEGLPIDRVFDQGNRRFLDIVRNSEEVTDTEVRIFSNQSSNDYSLNCRPIRGRSGEALGKVLILSEIKRVKTLVTKMIGAKANFRFQDIYGRNSVFLRTVEQAKLVSHSASNVLLLGKSGTGKDIFAQAIHNASNRANGPYVAINCAAIPRDLISSELFGYSEGAFTGSRRGGNQGKFELADGGTIFLDEIAETPLELQAVLLRVIEDKSIVRIGGKMVRPVDVRVIAATNRDLRREIQKGNFREDLYYRLNIFAIHMIPLNRRLDDLPILLDCFVKKYGIILGKKIKRISPGVLEAFMRYSWPGNVRELQNVVERMMHFATREELTVDLIPPEILDAPPSGHLSELSGPRDDSVERPLVPAEADASRNLPEKEAIRQMLEMGITIKKIAEKMNLSRMTIYRKMKQYGLTKR